MYGLSAMTGILPVIVVAGAATQMTKSMFQKPQPTRRKKKKSRKSGVGFGSFSNVGF